MLENSQDTTDAGGTPHSVLADFGIGLVTDRELLRLKGITATGFTQTFGASPGTSRSGTRLYQAPELEEESHQPPCRMSTRLESCFFSWSSATCPAP
jgi:hypothetical protein